VGSDRFSFGTGASVYASAMKARSHLLLAMLALCLAPSAARADDSADHLIGVTDEVQGHPGISYLDLLKQIVPDLSPGDTGAAGHVSEPFRNIAGPDFAGDPPDSLEVTYVEPMVIEAEGKQRLLVIADFGATPDRVADETVMGLFDDSPTPRLLDVAEVALDRFTGFATAPTVRISPHDEAVAVSSSHSNSSQSYEPSALIFVRRDKLELIDTFFGFGETECNFRQDEGLSFKEKPGSGSPYWSFTASILRTTGRSKGEDCADPAPSETIRKTFSATYSWDAKLQRFTTRSHQLRDLAKTDSALNQQ
jgi:hypothetical protein